MVPEDLVNRPLAKAPEMVIGYHGCPQSLAVEILAEQRFLPSTKAYDWLGEGTYFWEYGPFRAREWAHIRCASTGDQPAVIGAVIRLGRCLNLLDTEHIPALEAVYQQLVVGLGTENLPRNTARGAHYLDRSVVDTYSRTVEQMSLFPFQTVRGSFPEGGPIYAGSKILRKAHSQIAVRDASCIFDLHLVHFD